MERCVILGQQRMDAWGWSCSRRGFVILSLQKKSHRSSQVGSDDLHHNSLLTRYGFAAFAALAFMASIRALASAIASAVDLVVAVGGGTAESAARGAGVAACGGGGGVDVEGPGEGLVVATAGAGGARAAAAAPPGLNAANLAAIFALAAAMAASAA